MAGGVKQWLAAFRLWLSRSFESRSTTSKTSVLYGPDLLRLTAASRLGKDELVGWLPTGTAKSKAPLSREVERGRYRSRRFLASPGHTVGYSSRADPGTDFSRIRNVGLAHRAPQKRGDAQHHAGSQWVGTRNSAGGFVRVLISLRQKLDSITGSTPSYIRAES